MALKDRINEDLRAALRSGDELRKTTLRGLLSAVRQAEDAKVRELVPPEIRNLKTDDIVLAGKDPQEIEIERISVELTDEDVEQVIRRQVKQRQDSIEQFARAGRKDLVEKETAEAAILQAYLPQQMPREQIVEEARAVIAETGASGLGDKGKVMPVIMKRLQGKADGREINAVVSELLAAKR